jgi:hypothetical protein
MKLYSSLIFAFAISVILVPSLASSAEQGKKTDQPVAECVTNKAGMPTCKKKSGASESTETSLMAECVFTCRKQSGIWVCVGNGPQCFGKSPWD